MKYGVYTQKEFIRYKEENSEKRAERIKQSAEKIDALKKQQMYGNESSMLSKKNESLRLEIINNLRARFQTKIDEIGGIDAVIEELEQYLVEKIGDPSAALDFENRKYTHDDPIQLKTYKTALRGLLDPSIPRQGFPSMIHKGVESDVVSAADERFHARELVALYWLAASDIDMPLDESNASKRAQCIDEEKENFIMQLCDIRRAHNEDTPEREVSEIDYSSCPPGVFSRLTSSPVHNQMSKVSELQISSVDYQQEIKKFMIAQFKNQELESQKNIVNALMDVMYMIEDEAEEYLQFLEDIKSLDNLNAFS